MDDNDRELVARVLLDDDRFAFAEIVRRHQSRVRSLLRRLSGNAALADDLAQETFLRAYRGLSGFRADARLSTWICQIAFNTFRTEAARGRSMTSLDEAGAGELPVSEHEADASRSHLRADIERALDVLDPDERAAVSLAYGHDLTHEDAARVMGVPLGSLKTLLARSAKKLAPKLREWDHDERR